MKELALGLAMAGILLGALMGYQLGKENRDD